jgi:hypothetical protein
MNLGARFSKAGYSRLVERSDGDDDLATHVGTRPDIPHHLFLRLLAGASAIVRDKLIAAHPEATPEINGAVAMVVDRMQKDAQGKSTNYSAAKASIESLQAMGKLADSAIREFAEKGRLEEIIVGVEKLCDISIEVIEQAFVQGQSETMLVLAKAAGLSWPTTKAILLLGFEQRALTASHIDQCMASFERLSVDTARKIVKFYKIRRASNPAEDRAAEGAKSKKGALAAIEHPLPL